MKLNIGSGPHPCPGWVNLEMDASYDCQVLGSIFALPFADGAFSHVYLGHVLEHLPWDHLPHALGEVWRVLRPTGQLMVVGPDLDRAVGTDQPYWLLHQIRTTQGVAPDSPPGMAHLWTATELLTLVGVRQIFADAKPVPVGEVLRPDWPNTVPDAWQFAIAATR